MGLAPAAIHRGPALVVAARPEEGTPMAMDIRCRLRLHRYRPKKNDLREVYWECTRCGHMKAYDPPDPGMFGGGVGG